MTLDGKYRELKSSEKEFRLIELHPADVWSTTVRVSLRHGLLCDDLTLAFETVSYVWGDPQNQDLILVDDTFAHVPASAVAALRRMRLPSACRTLWIDALCINQSDVKERSEQVKIMGEIYKASKGNLIYLGEVKDDQRTRLALSNIRAIIDEMNEETRNLSLVTDTVFDREREGRRPKLATSGMGFKVEEEALESQIFGLPWFR